MGITDHLFYDLMKSHSAAGIFQNSLPIIVSILLTLLAAYLMALNFFDRDKLSSDKQTTVRNVYIIIMNIATLVLLLVSFGFSTSKMFHKTYNYSVYKRVITKITSDKISFKIDENEEGLVIKYKDGEILASDSEMYHFIEDTAGRRGFEYLISIEKTKSGDYKASYKCRCGKIKTYLLSESMQN